MRVRRYVEDSTKGNALIRPKNYKGDSLVQAWVDRRKLAMLSMWLEGGGYEVRHLSDVLRFTIDEVVENLVSNGIVEKIEFTTDAVQVLMKYKADLNPSNRGMRNLNHNLHLDEMRREKVFSGEINQAPSDSGIMAQARRDAEKAAKVYREMEKSRSFKSDIERLDKGREDSMKKHRENFDYGEDGVIKRGGKDRVVVNVEENLRKMKEIDEKLKEM